jgi:hypothetical protein
MRALAIVLIVLGILALGYQGFSYVTHEKVLDIGPVEITQEKTKTVPLPPVFGVVALVIGIVLLVTNTGPLKH